jgi:arylsulfatase
MLFGGTTGSSTLLLRQKATWLLVPIQGKIKEFFSDFDQFPYQQGSSLNAGGINYAMLRQQDALRRLNELERLSPQ